MWSGQLAGCGCLGQAWDPAWEGGAGRLPGRAGGQRHPGKAASQWDRRFPVRTASPGVGWRKKTEMLKPGVDEGVRSSVWKAEGGGGGTAERSVGGVWKVSGSRVPGRRGSCRSGERK